MAGYCTQCGGSGFRRPSKPKPRLFEAGDVVAAILRPSHYTGTQGERTDSQWRADAVAAYLNGKGRLIEKESI